MKTLSRWYFIYRNSFKDLMYTWFTILFECLCGILMGKWKRSCWAFALDTCSPSWGLLAGVLGWMTESVLALEPPHERSLGIGDSAGAQQRLIYLLGSLPGITGSFRAGPHLICFWNPGNWHSSWHVIGAQKMIADQLIKWGSYHHHHH